MKITIEYSDIERMKQTYGVKAPAAIMEALEVAVLECNPLGNSIAGITLNYEGMVRRLKISQRKSVAMMETARDILNYFNSNAGKSFKLIETNLKPIACLLKNYEKATIINVIDNKVSQWKGDFQMDKYLRPETIFAPKKFDGYANELAAPEVQLKNFANKLDSLLGN